MTPVRVGVIGVGSLGQHHARVYAEVAGANLVGVADVDAARAQEVAGRHGCRAVVDFRTLLAEVEAVSVVVPTLLHHEIAQACLSAGVHVLMEKPLAATAADAQALAEDALKRGMVLQVGHIERFNAAFRAVRGTIKSPMLIECRRWAPFTPRGADVDVVLDVMIHDLDLVLSLVGEPWSEVQAAGLAILSPTTDVAHARVAFRNGTVALFSANRVAESKVREMRVSEPDGFVAIDLMGQTAVIGRRTMGTTGCHEMRMELARGDGREPLKLELEAFLDSIRTGSPPVVPGRAGAAALVLAEAIVADITGHGRKELRGATDPHHRG